MNIRYRTKMKKQSQFIDFSLIFLLSLAFCIFYIPAYYALPHKAYVLWQYLIIIDGLISIIIYLFRRKVTVRWIVFLIALICYYFISSFLGSDIQPMKYIVYLFLKTAGFVTLLELSLQWNKEKAIKAFIYSSFVMCTINYISFLYYRNIVGGMLHGQHEVGEAGKTTQHWFFFNHDNYTAFIYIACLSILWFYAIESNKLRYKIYAFISSFLTLYMYIDLWSVTAMVGTVLFLAICFLSLNTRLRCFLTKRLSYYFACLVGVCFSIAVIFLNAGGWYAKAVRMLGKTGTSGLRGIIWNRSLQFISHNPIVGYGYEQDNLVILKLTFNHCHNFVLQILYTGGILSFIFFVLFIVLCEVKGVKVKSACILTGAISVLFLLSTFDWYLSCPVMFAPFIVYANCGNFFLRKDN